tara:strand:- start:117 stop:2681 length:2565 start_codon:yes stop_codon:yes gene_type:complete
MTTSGVSFEKETKALSKRVLDFFERVRYAYLSAKENPKEYGKKWKSTVKSIREEYDGLGEFASELKDSITEKELFDDKVFDAESLLARRVYEDVKRMRFESKGASDPFSEQLGDKVLEVLLEDKATFAAFIHYALRSHSNPIPKKAWQENDLKPDEITQGYMGLDLEDKDIPLYIIEHYGDDKDSKRVKGKFKEARELLEKVYDESYSEEKWDSLVEVDIAKSEEEKEDIDFIIPNKPMYRIFELDDMKDIKGLSGEYVVQEKYDGMRIQIHKMGDNIKVYSYNEKDITDKCPEIVEKMNKKGIGDCILDGELLLFQGDEALHRASVITHVFKKKIPDTKLRAHVFDVMKHEGKDLMDEPLRERINIMFYQYSQHSSEELAFPSKKDTRIADSMKEVGEYAEKIMEMPTSEGVVIKDIESTYYMGRKKNPKWIKWKKFVDLDVIVLEDKKTKSGLHSYTMGIGPLTAEQTREMKTMELDDKNYLPVGKALNTKVEVDVGSIIRVKVDEVTKKGKGFSLYSAKVIELPEVDESDKLETLEQLATKTKKALMPKHPFIKPSDLANPLTVIAELQQEKKDKKRIKKYIVTDYVHGEAEIICKHELDGFTVYGFDGDQLMQKNALHNMDVWKEQLEKLMKSRKSKLRVAIRKIIEDNQKAMEFDELEEKLRVTEEDAYDEIFEGKPKNLLSWMKNQDAFIFISPDKFDVSPENIEKDEDKELTGEFEVRQREDGNLDFVIQTDKDRMAWLIDLEKPEDIFDLFGKSGKYPAKVSEKIDSTKIIDSGELIFGVQRDGYHEYRMEGDKFQTRIHFRVVPLDEKKSWIVFTGKKQDMLDDTSDEGIIDITKDKYSNLELPE